ncbi:raffinose synthase 1 [Cystoisospora suis]|uniref:galactinol--sucrose galactosyltransferase n=1 Tax=Cystoisospora suis TaxID=483139 RepID=A0A2C6KBC7_9APIC|nr:raffinose synthase 1 [Cystoisospora suis]
MKMDDCDCCHSSSSFLSVSPEPQSCYSSPTAGARRISADWLVHTARFEGPYSSKQFHSRFSSHPPTCLSSSPSPSCNDTSPVCPSETQDDSCNKVKTTGASPRISPRYFSFFSLLSVQWRRAEEQSLPFHTSGTSHAGNDYVHTDDEADRPWECTVPLTVCERLQRRPATACNRKLKCPPQPSSSSSTSLTVSLSSSSPRSSRFKWEICEVKSSNGERTLDFTQLPLSGSPPAVSPPQQEEKKYDKASGASLGKLLCLYSWKLSWTAPVIAECLSSIPSQTLFVLAQARSPCIRKAHSSSSITPSRLGESSVTTSSAHTSLSPSFHSSPSEASHERREGLFLIAPLADLQGRSVSTLSGQQFLHLEGGQLLLQVTTGNSKQVLGKEPVLLLAIHSNLPLPELTRLFSFVVSDLLQGTCIPRDLKLPPVTCERSPLTTTVISTVALSSRSGVSPSSAPLDSSSPFSSSDVSTRCSLCTTATSGELSRHGAYAIKLPVSSHVESSSSSSCRSPLLLSEIGWCSWDAYGKSITADAILQTARLVRPGWVLIDDGWQLSEPYPSYENPTLGNTECVTSLDGIPSIFKDFGNLKGFIRTLNTLLSAPSFPAVSHEANEKAIEEDRKRKDSASYKCKELGRCSISSTDDKKSGSRPGLFQESLRQESFPSRVLLWHCLLGGWKGVSFSLAHALNLPAVREHVLPTFPPGLHVAAAPIDVWKREMSILPVGAFPAFYDAFYSYLSRLGIHGTKVDHQAMAAYVSEGCTDGACAATYTNTSLLSMHLANQKYISRQEKQKGRENLPTASELSTYDDAMSRKELSCTGQSFNLINCMGIGVPNIYLGGASLIVRSSEDHAFHGVGPGCVWLLEEYHTRGRSPSHMRTYSTSFHSSPRYLVIDADSLVATGSELVVSSFSSPVLPVDWDMFRICAWHSRIHAIARVISGGPIYISDRFESLRPPAQGEDKEPWNSRSLRETPWRRILRKLCVPGTDLPIFARCTGIAMPTEDCLFVNPLDTCVGYKVVNTCAAGALVAVFGLHDSGSSSYMAVITIKDVLPFLSDNPCRTGGGDLTGAVEATAYEEYLCTDLEQGWESEGEKINAAVLHPQFGWTVTPVYFMTARLFAVTPIYVTGWRSGALPALPGRFTSAGTHGISMDEVLRLSLIGGRTPSSTPRPPSSVSSSTFGRPDEDNSPSAEGSLDDIQRETLLSPYAPPLVFTAVAPVWAEIQPGEICSGETEAENRCQTAPHMSKDEWSDQGTKPAVDQKTTRDERRGKATREGVNSREAENTAKKLVKGVAFQIHEATRHCSVLVWSDGSRPPYYCGPLALRTAVDRARDRTDGNEQERNELATTTVESHPHLRRVDKAEESNPPTIHDPESRNPHTFSEESNPPTIHDPESRNPHTSNDFSPISFFIEDHPFLPLRPVQTCPHGGVLYELRVNEREQRKHSFHFLW